MENIIFDHIFLLLSALQLIGYKRPPLYSLTLRKEEKSTTHFVKEHRDTEKYKEEIFSRKDTKAQKGKCPEEAGICSPLPFFGGGVGVGAKPSSLTK